MGQTRVDLQHLLEDIRDAYPGAVEETILTEIVANSLDSGARTLRFECDPAGATLTVVDDGSGMVRRELARYHDVAASSKNRGEGIGFAGVGIKLGLLASEEVLTETRRGSVHVASSWRLASRQKAPWRWVPAPGLVSEHGTAVRLRLRNPLSPLLETGFVEAALLRHFEPLLDAAFDEVLAHHYPGGVRLFVNAREMERLEGSANSYSPIAIRLGRKRRPSATGYLFRSEVPLAEEQRGVAVSTLGKVIKRGWDWLGFEPSEPGHVAGLIEVPGLAESLTLNKADFIRTGSRGAVYLAFRKAIQEAVAGQLAAWGDSRNARSEEARRRKTRPLERDVAAVLLEMAEDFPLIASLVDRKPGGQKRLPMTSMDGRGSASRPVPEAMASGEGVEGVESGPAGVATSPEPTNGSGGDAQEIPAHEASPEPPGDAMGSVLLPAAHGRRRPARLGLTLQFENRPDDPSMARLLESTVWINDGHPAYLRAAASRAEGYHVAVAVAMALAPLAVEPNQTHSFVTAFLACWGEALVERPALGRRKERRPMRRRSPGEGAAPSEGVRTP